MPRVNFFRWFLRRCVDKSHFPRRILFTNEAKLTREGVINFRKSLVWADENPRATHPHDFQQHYGFNMWAGCLDGCIIGPYLLPPNITGDAYLNFPQHVLHELLEDVTLHVRQIMWFQHDGAPTHFTNEVRGHRNQSSGQTWIGRGGPIA